jgi:N-acetylglucosamine kinase-like BadF-type ATPase
VAFFLGIDGGGTKTSCVVADESSILGSGTAGGSNIVRCGEAHARESLAAAVRQALTVAGVTPAQITRTCVGAAGAGREEIRAVLQQILTELVAGEVLIVGDMMTTLEAAFNGGPGVVVIAGTGSLAFGRNADGEMARAGGWGFAISDEGSGHWIGRAAVSASLREMDESGSSSLLERIQKAWRVDVDALVPMANASPGPNFAELMPVVVSASESGDMNARTVLTRAGSELAAIAAIVIRKLFPAGESIPVAMSGGVFRHCALVRQVFYNTVKTEFAEAVVGATVIEPVRGALEIARRGS